MHNHLNEILAIDFAVVPTATFGILYVFFVLSLERQRVLHFNVTRHPTLGWTAEQVVEACPFVLPGRFQISNAMMTRSTEKIFGIESMGLGSIRYPRLFDPLGRTDLQKVGSPAYEEIGWTTLLQSMSASFDAWSSRTLIATTRTQLISGLTKTHRLGAAAALARRSVRIAHANCTDGIERLRRRADVCGNAALLLLVRWLEPHVVFWLRLRDSA